jgi:hypothetical protein
MDIRNLPDAVASTMLGVAHELDETAIDHELVNGSTVTGKAMRLVATSLVLGAIPWIALDVVTGGLGRRADADEDRTQASPDANPVWWEFLPR